MNYFSFFTILIPQVLIQNAWLFEWIAAYYFRMTQQHRGHFATVNDQMKSLDFNKFSLF